MEQEFKRSELKSEIVGAKDLDERRFNHLTDNFYVMRSALRYYSVKKGKSFTSSELSEDFPLAITVAGSCLNMLSELEVVEPRTHSSSPDRYLPEKVNLGKMEKIGEILRENHEIDFFTSDDQH